jgi:hypothetical protein
MNKLLIVVAALVMAGTANAAGIPLLNYSCPGEVSVHADEGGPIYINGEEAETKKFSDAYFEAEGSDVTVSISIGEDDSASVTYTGPGGANGICQPSEA